MNGSTYLSVNGELRSVYQKVPADEHNAAYSDVAIGQPLLIRFERIMLSYPHAASNTQTILVSNYLKTIETKLAAAESIVFFFNDVPFDNGRASLLPIPANAYGHPLCYYTKSYLGETVSLTIRAQDINDDGTIKALGDALASATGSLAGLPILMDVLPYMGLIQGGIQLFTLLAEYLLAPRTIVDGHDLTLSLDDGELLQSGRLIGLPGVPEGTFDSNSYRLSEGDSRLLRRDNGAEYEGSYFVILVDAKAVPKYEGFDYLVGAADILASLNRRKVTAAQFVEQVAQGVKGINDMELVQQMRELGAIGGAGSSVQIRALYNAMSPEMQLLAKPLYNSFETSGSGN